MFTGLTKNWAAAVVALVLVGSSVRGEDSLFSGDSLFGQATQKADPNGGEAPGDYETAPTQPSAPAAPRTLTDENLDATLREAGLNPRQDEGKRIVDLEVAGLNVPARVELENGRLVIAIKLANVANAEKSPAIQARVLLQANAIVAPAIFAFNLADEQLELKLALRNVDLSAALLKLEFEGLAKVATATEKLWSIQPQIAETPAQAPPVQAQPPVQQPAPPVKPATPGLNLAGRWVVELKQGGGFVIRFESDGKFLLGHVKADGKIDRSEGTFTVANGELVMKSNDGSTLQGKFAPIDADKFSFAVGNANGLIFQRR